ncbi:ComEC/Rec2 family competence protein [Natronoflexus pectinivorans]|nr:MBL fold metallo-hydrolase [Natronoflexus pectinivorans]
MDNGEVLRSQLKIVSDSEAKNYGLNVVAFNVGHGTSVLFFLPNGETLLVDTGYDHMAEKYTIPFMKSHLPVNRHGKQRIDHIFISHWHYDHFHGLNNILDAFDVGSIKYNLSEPERGDWRKDPYNYAKHGFEPVHSPQFKVGNVIDDIGGDDVKIKILNAAEFDLERYPYFHSKYFGEWDNANNRSLSFILKFKDFVFNFGGDTYQHGQIAMLQHFPELLAKTHVYHGNHHFHGGLSTDFLKHINPYLFIASACDVAYDRAAFVSDVMNNVVPTLEQESNIFIENLHTFEVGHIVIRVDGSLDWTDSSTEIIYETYYSEADDFPKFRILYLD